ncbi:entericidin A/B family lipoprotein [Leclercia sp. 29361]|jgi:entericidin A|uniref:Entericidin A/B family lipoprotein n=1 Tax=Leclercia tamurae TaxID=2926467 RepID=A0ABT2RCG5_9ENTR|nr:MULTISPECIES: entericidin A/B family lipoprotein [Leclercia]MCT9844694.1 entericidin A/B family lipoprotein [Leclercia adecarboxylata ATCC 23216 = NBRC 102595]PSS49290.1 entericidin EcnA/B family protein [Enterobacter sp. FS01]MCU6678483.1 entericidin A/B family lipoprotein [Leclercia tamurae]MCU6681684.1 entericidin A/B family lipoprotein [Leclercia tamurae]MDY0921098.1 entericidin A/B family lipoprotein [Leclercia sp. CFBP8987]
MQHTIKILLLMVLASSLLSGCNTARGVGEDIKSLGHAISRAAS